MDDRERGMTQSPLVSDGPCVRGVTRLTLDRPDQANAISAELAEALLAAFDRAAANGTRVLVLAAKGRSFSGGFDFAGYEAASEGDLLLRFVRIEQMLQRLWASPFVSIAIVNGVAFGAGADVVAACTYRVGSDRCRFRFPGYRFGVALGTSRLATIVGQQTARDILLANRLLSGEEALACSLLTHLEANESIDQVVEKLIEQTSDLDPISLATLLARCRSGKDNAATDLAHLVTSVSRSGLHERIKQYRAANLRPKAGQAKP